MGSATLSPTAVSVRNAKPDYVYGATAKLPMLSGQSAALVRVGMPSDIPSNAVITSAILTFQQHGAFTGSKSFTVRRNSAAWTTSKATWNKKPAQTGTTVTVTQSGTADLTAWAFDVTADVTAFVAGTAVNYGWLLATTSSAAGLLMRGSAASVGKPQLVITYATPTDAPTDLSPTGNQAVSVAKPMLTFQAPPDTTYVNVQIDADMVAPYDYDSGDVASTVGVFDTSATAWAGLTAGGASVYWRARTKSDYGYSAWSAWAQMRRVAKPTVTITSPAATTDDTTPPIVWSTTGTQVAWQVIVTDPTGKVLANSGRINGSDTTWTPPKAVAKEGDSATIEVRVWDNEDRVATHGDPTYGNAVETFTAQGTASVTPALTVSAVPDFLSPRIIITATRASVPDSWTVVRDGVRIATGLPDPLNYEDWSANPHHAHTYRAAPYTNGVGTASGGPTVTVTPGSQGIWLIDPDDPEGFHAVIWGDDSGSFDATEIAVVHQPIAGPPVRRVSYRPPLTGSVTGDLLDVGDYMADDQIATLYDFKSNDRDLTLMLGDRSLTVRVGDLLIAPTPESTKAQRHATVSFTWWETGATPWSP